MVLPSIKPLKASGTGGLTPASKLLAWAPIAIDSAYSDLAVSL